MRGPEAIALALALAIVPAAARGGDASVALRWKPVDGAVEYELEIGADPDLRRVLVRERVPTPGYRWHELPDERRWWRARGVDARGRPGRWSEVKALEPVLRAPEARRPADGATVPGGSEAVLDCAPVPVVEAYELEIASDPAFTRVVERRKGTDPRFRVALRAGSYHWRVRGSVERWTTRWSAARRVSVSEVALAATATPDSSAIPAPTEEPASAAVGPAVTAATIAPAPEPAPTAAAAPGPESTATAEAAPVAREAGRLRAGARLGWHTTFGGISTLSPGVEAEWRMPRHERLSVSARVEYYGASSTIPAMPGLAAPVRATARVVPLGAALVWAHPYRSGAVYAGAGGQAQLVYTAVAGEERLDLVPGALLLAGVERRLGAGDLFAEAGWASGELDGEVARLKTGGFYLAAGFRGGP